MWTAPSSGSIIPAGLVDDYRRNSDINSSFEGASVRPRASISSSMFDSGNLVKQIGAGMKGSNTTQRITNNITIQSQEPVMDASKLMSNVAKMRARRGMMR
jgi:ornithine carbamoyltransferase